MHAAEQAVLVVGEHGAPVAADTELGVVLSSRSGGEGAVGEVVGGSEAAAVVREHCADVRPGLDERAEGVEGSGGGRCGRQRAAGREGSPAVAAIKASGSRASMTEVGSRVASEPSRTGRISARAEPCRSHAVSAQARVGSVGTRAWMLLLLGDDGDDDVDPLFLQAK